MIMAGSFANHGHEEEEASKDGVSNDKGTVDVEISIESQTYNHANEFLKTQWFLENQRHNKRSFGNK